MRGNKLFLHVVFPPSVLRWRYLGGQTREEVQAPTPRLLCVSVPQGSCCPVLDTERWTKWTHCDLNFKKKEEKNPPGTEKKVSDRSGKKEMVET